MTLDYDEKARASRPREVELLPAHDPSNWTKHFEPMLREPHVHLANTFRNQYLLLYYLLLLPEGRFLEVGCGTARTSVLLQRLRPTCEVIASDVEDQVCKLARNYIALCGSNVPVVHTDAVTLPYPGDHFIATFSQGLLEHYDDSWINRYLDEQLRVAQFTLMSLPTAHHYMIARQYGDERKLFPADWLEIFRGRNLIEIHTQGEPGEEHGLLCMIARRKKWTVSSTGR